MNPSLFSLRGPASWEISLSLRLCAIGLSKSSRYSSVCHQTKNIRCSCLFSKEDCQDRKYTEVQGNLNLDYLVAMKSIPLFSWIENVLCCIPLWHQQATWLRSQLDSLFRPGLWFRSIERCRIYNPSSKSFSCWKSWTSIFNQYKKISNLSLLKNTESR